MPTMIFHAPFPLNREAKAASGIRPVKMYDAFVAEGYDVILVAGSASERRKAIRRLKKTLAEGQSVDFLYSESANIPLTLSEPKHYPPHPFLDRSLFRLCTKHKIPTSIFYRDIYWAFDIYRQLAGAAVATLMRALFRYELRWYRRYVSRVYLPSIPMSHYVPILNKESFKPLPPGAPIRNVESLSTEYDLNLLYVGGLGSHYQLHSLFDAVSRHPSIGLTVCVHEAQWESARQEYEPYLAPNISIVHRSGDELDELYAKADIATLVVEPSEYWSFAVPVKLFEYLGFAKPILCSENIYAAEFVRENECGWVVPNRRESIEDELVRLLLDRPAVEEMRKRSEKIRHLHTWRARARQVAEELSVQS